MDPDDTTGKNVKHSPLATSDIQIFLQNLSFYTHNYHPTLPVFNSFTANRLKVIVFHSNYFTIISHLINMLNFHATTLKVEPIGLEQNTCINSFTVMQDS